MSFRLHIFNTIGALLPNRGGFAIRRALLRAAGVNVGYGTRIACGVRVYDRHLEIGESTWIGMDTRLMSCSHGYLRIGSRVDIAPMCLIGTGTHEVGTGARRAGSGAGRDVSIGNGSWIGMGSVILPGAEIGIGCIVAAGSVVLSGNYPENSLIAGVPAKAKKALPP